ncbi:MAG TPA: DEAD/DEAH box helicase [Hyphomicrobium sp.]
MESKTFADLGLSPKVQAAITAAGYVNPTPIQAAAIPVAVTGRDVLGIAQTGTGKTAGFVLPMITRLESGRARARMPRSLILAPTRELAAQVAQSFEKYGVNHKLAVALLIGGVSMDDQVKKLDRGVDVLIATPGRLLDHFGRGRIMLMGVEILVIDEADRMLDMGFIPDIEKICKLLPPRRQTLFFSATMPPEITRLVSQFLNDPIRIEVAKPATTAKTITQRFVYCANGEDWAKREVLRDLIRNGNVKNAIIFCNRKRDVAVLHKSLAKHGFNAGALHGDMDQTSRTDTLDKFRAGEIMLLAASDVAARGLDIPDVSHVFNFDLPWAADDYVHRIGRTGRAGREGYSASLVSPDDLKFVSDIEKVTGESAVWLGEPPTEEDIAGAGKRRRGRGGRSAPAGKSARPRNGSERGDRPPERPRSGAGDRPVRDPEAPKAPEDRAVGRGAERNAHGGERQPQRERRPERDRPRSAEQPARDEQQRQPRPAPRAQPAADSWTDAPKAPRRQPSGERQAGSRDAAREPREKAIAAPRKGDDRLGFAENVPAFMRKPPRPVKAPGRD